MSNLVAMALTMAGPRLWILIKALFAWLIGIYERARQGRVNITGFQSRHILLAHNLVLLKSHIQSSERLESWSGLCGMKSGHAQCSSYIA